MLSSVVSWCPPHGVVVSTLSSLVNGSKLAWKFCPPWCHGFHPHGVMVSCLVHGLKLDWKFVSVVFPKWHHGVVSFSSWKQWTLTLKSCDHSFRPIRRLHSVKSDTSLEKLWDFMQKEFPFKEQSCETALLKMYPFLTLELFLPPVCGTKSVFNYKYLKMCKLELYNQKWAVLPCLLFD